MSQNRNIMEFFKKAPPKVPAPKRAAVLPEKISKKPPRSTSLEPGDSITVVPCSVTSIRSKSARPMAAPRKPAAPIVNPTTSRQGTTLCQSSSSSLSSLPSSSLFQQSQPELHTDRSSSPPPSITTMESESDDAMLSLSSISSNHWLQQSQTSSLPKTSVEPAFVSKPPISNNRVIQNSDDEDHDSDSDSLPDILADFKSKGQASSVPKTAKPITPPRPSRGKKIFNFHSSPLTVQPKYAVDMKSLIKQSKLDGAAEEKAKRLKTMMEPTQDMDGDSVMSDDVGDDEVVDHDNMVDMLVGDSDGSEAENRKAVLRRATGTVTEMIFYFFETQAPSAAQRQESRLPEPAQTVPSTVGSPVFHCICGDPGEVNDHTDSIACDTCKKWQHRKCVIPARHQAEPQEEAPKPQRMSRKRVLDELRPHNGSGHIEQEDKADAPPTVRAPAAQLIVFTCTSCKEKKELAEKVKYGRLGLTFPTHAVTSDWKRELEDPKVRHQSFTSGFAEDMVRLGRALPDELFIWLLDELCFERNDLLRHSYCGVLENCPREQTHRLLQPEVVQSLFRKLGGTTVNTSFTEKIKPVKEVPDPYPARDWASLRSIVGIFGRLAHSLRQKTRFSVICLLLRMGADRTVMNNVDLLCSVHTTLSSLCDSVPEVSWDSCCQEVSRALFNSAQEAALRYQITKCIPSNTPETCDLRRRFAAASFFENISLCDKDMFLNNDINKYTNYLNEPHFKITANTDFHELAALISLLDIAIDDGQYSGLDLDDKKIVKEHNRDIQILGARIKAIWQKITPTVSKTLHLKIEAKTSMELINHRIEKVLPIPIKIKPKKDFLLSLRKGYEDVEEEKAGMAKWVKKPALLKTEDDDLEDPQLVELLRK